MRRRSFLSGLPLRQWHRFARSEQIALFASALAIGLVVAYGAILFRIAIGAVQWLFYGFADEAMHSRATLLPWWHLLLAPAVGGLLVGLLLRLLMANRRPQAVAAVIEAAALHDGRMSARQAAGAAIVSATSLGIGGSAGREGPVVHLGAAIASALAQRLNFGRSITTTLLGCGIASAIAASFNAPMAGVLFALEVIIGHHALRAFAPIVLASVVGTVVSRIHLGNFPAFAIPGYAIASPWEFPAFFLLGLASAAVAMVFMWSIMTVEDVVKRVPRVPEILVPGIGGLLVGAIAVFFPQVLGVGYEATNEALNEQLSLGLMLALLVAKTAATAITLGSRFGGGVFSPALYVGAMTGGAFGIVAAAAFPALASSHSLYAIAGMGAVAAAVLGAPMSTILIVFELTGDYQVTLAVMVAVVVASVATQQTLGGSFFRWQLRRQGLDLSGGRALNLLSRRRVREVMTDEIQVIGADTGVRRLRALLQTARHGEFCVIDQEGRLVGTLPVADLVQAAFDPNLVDLVVAGDLARPNPVVLTGDDTLDEALRLMDAIAEDHVPVVETRESMKVIGLVHHRHVLRAYNRALLRARAEERGE